MIQPLDTSRNSWRLLWLDLEEPVPKPAFALNAPNVSGGGLQGSEPEYYLPTCLLVTTSGGKPLCPPEILEELDQARAEQLLSRLFDEHGTPDRLTIAESPEWDTEAWQTFAVDCRIEIAFGAFPTAKPGDLLQFVRRITQRLRGEGFHSPSAIARGLVVASRRLRSPGKKSAHLKKALEQDADCILARIELADTDYQAARWTECRRGYQELIDREKRRWKGESPEWWSDPETRPYLRALYGRAMTEWHQGQFTETAKDLEQLLTLNPIDNQGVRFLIPLVYLLGENDAKALKSLSDYEDKYPDDYCEPALLFGKGIALWRSGDEEGAAKAYREAMLKNLYIAPLLLDLPTPSSEIWHPNDRAEPGYAQDFMQSYATLWDRDPAALRFLRETYTSFIPSLDKVIAHRQQMSERQDQRYDREFKNRWKAMTDIDEQLTGGADR
jgi:tetratricopeptide (TPR) repeat protein